MGVTTVAGKWTWGDFWRRFRSRNLGEDDVNPLFYRVPLPWLIFCLLGLLIPTDTGLLKFAYKVILFTSAPIWICLFGLLAYCAPPSTPRRSSAIAPLMWMIVWPVVGGIFFAYVTIGMFFWYNAFSGSPEIVLVHGPVTEMFKGSGGRYVSAGRYVKIEFENREVVLEVPKQIYERANIGDQYAVKMRRGGLGYFYQWPKVFSEP